MLITIVFRISLPDIAAKLQLDSSEDAEYIVSKVYTCYVMSVQCTYSSYILYQYIYILLSKCTCRFDHLRDTICGLS